MKRVWGDERPDVTPEEKQFVVDVLEKFKQSAKSNNTVLRVDAPNGTLNAALGALAIKLLLCRYSASVDIEGEHGDALCVSIMPSSENDDRQVLKLMKELFEIGEQQETELTRRQREREQQEKEQAEQEERIAALMRLQEELRKVS